MTIENLNADHVVKLYKSGLKNHKLAEHLGVTITKLLEFQRSVGLKDGVYAPEVPEIISMYESGISENAIAKHFNMGRAAVRKTLIKNSVRIRSQSEAEALKWSRMTKEQRANQVAKAHEATRNLDPSVFKRAAKLQAIAKENTLSKVGFMESEFCDQFEQLGFSVFPQKAFGAYNIDILLDDFAAIEIHANCCHPHTHRYYRKRVVNLLKGGYHVIYIKTLANVDPERAAKKVASMIDLIRSDNSGICHYGVIRGDGRMIATGCLNGDELSTVKALDGFFAAVER